MGGRTDLRLVGRGLVVSVDGGIPICSHTYAGNKPVVTQFAGIVTELVKRWGPLATSSDELTLVYDAGQDSAANQAHIEASPLHFIGSLPPADHPDLLAVPADRFGVVDAERFAGLSAFDTRGNALGAQRRMIVTHSPTLHTKQAQGFEQTMTSASRRLAELAERLARGKTRKTRAGIEADIASILKPRWLTRLITATLAGTEPSDFALQWAVDREAVEALDEENFGKRILFTDRDDWTVAAVVAGYRSQSSVENDFRQMKDPHVVSFSPMFYWTDQNIKGHSFYRVLALTVARLMARQVAGAGMKNERQRTARHPRRHTRDRPALPLHRRPAQSWRMLTDTDATQKTSPRPIPPRHLRPKPCHHDSPARRLGPLETALRQHRPLHITYHGKQRLICPHALGWKNNRPMLLAYQTGGHTTSGTLPADPRQRWRCMFIDEIDHVDPADPANTWATADNYNYSHPFNAIDQVTLAIAP